MTVQQWLMLVTCAGLLALGVVAILRVRESPLAAPLAAVCVVGFAWRFCVWAHSLTNAWSWVSLECTFAPFNVTLALHFVLVFLGAQRRMRYLLRFVYVAGAGLGGVGASGLVSEWGRRAVVEPPWNGAVAALMLGSLLTAGWLLARHLRAQRSPEESMRTKIMLTGIAVALVLLAIALLAPDPHVLIVTLMAVGLLLLTTVTFGFRLFDSALTGLAAVYSGSLVAIGVGGYFVAFYALPSMSSLLLLAGFALAVCLAALGLRAASVIVQHQARVTRLTALGRWSAYMAHDLKNPIAALKGAAQFLAQERALGRSIDEQQVFLELLVLESDRLSRLVDHYQRFGGFGVSKETTPLNELIGRVLAPERARMPGALRVTLDLQPGLPDCALDRELFGVALENLLRNAVEAMPAGGTLTLRTALARGEAQAACVAVSVEDTGHGMSPRQVPWAFDEFFSTKKGGRGLGLALVKRVADAHGGSVQIASHLGEGTRVVLTFPVT